MFNGLENFQTAAAEQLKIDRQFSIHFVHQRKTLKEPVPRTLHFKTHQVAECRAIIAVSNISFTDSVARQVFQRKIDAAFGVICAYILPKVGQLKCGTSEIRELLALPITISAE